MSKAMVSIFFVAMAVVYIVRFAFVAMAVTFIFVIPMSIVFLPFEPWNDESVDEQEGEDNGA